MLWCRLDCYRRSGSWPQHASHGAKQGEHQVLHKARREDHSCDAHLHRLNSLDLGSSLVLDSSENVVVDRAAAEGALEEAICHGDAVSDCKVDPLTTRWSHRVSRIADE